VNRDWQLVATRITPHLHAAMEALVKRGPPAAGIKFGRGRVERAPAPRACKVPLARCGIELVVDTRPGGFGAFLAKDVELCICFDVHPSLSAVGDTCGSPSTLLSHCGFVSPTSARALAISLSCARALARARALFSTSCARSLMRSLLARMHARATVTDKAKTREHVPPFGVVPKLREQPSSACDESCHAIACAVAGGGARRCRPRCRPQAYGCCDAVSTRTPPHKCAADAHLC
jgi:hypothetical protein